MTICLWCGNEVNELVNVPLPYWLFPASKACVKCRDKYVVKKVQELNRQSEIHEELLGGVA